MDDPDAWTNLRRDAVADDVSWSNAARAWSEATDARDRAVAASFASRLERRLPEPSALDECWEFSQRPRNHAVARRNGT